VSDVIITEGLRSNIGYAPNVRILLKCISKAADNLRISKFRAYTGRECILLLQFPVQDFGLDHFTFQSFNFWSSSLLFSGPKDPNLHALYMYVCGALIAGLEYGLEQ